MDPDFPPIHPKDVDNLIEKTLSIFDAELVVFERHLESIVEIMVPYKMSLTQKPFEEYEKWLINRKEEVAERILFAICTDWFSRSLDEIAPDTERWWIAIFMLNGLCQKPHGQSVYQGYHLLESIALASRPGAWHSTKESGPHEMSWDPNAKVPRYGIIVHERGLESALWLMERLEKSDNNRRLLLIEWSALLLERQELVVPLGIGEKMLRAADDNFIEIPIRLTICLPRLLEADLATGLKLLEKLSNREEVNVQRGLADVLTRLFRRIEWKALPYLEKMLLSNDKTVLAAASSTVGDIRFLDEGLFGDKLSELSTHSEIIVRRNLVSHLRNYITIFPEDERGIFSTLWLDGDEVLAIRLRELLLRLDEVNTECFALIIKKIHSENASSLQPLWEVLDVRRKDRTIQWKKYLDEDGKLPGPIYSDNL
jgi:hypothetical protein|tara:strand:+ start:695 stop:1975 length:1281 start_codon:yes stop_codon:yes gene_type:complete